MTIRISTAIKNLPLGIGVPSSVDSQEFLAHSSLFMPCYTLNGLKEL